MTLNRRWCSAFALVTVVGCAQQRVQPDGPLTAGDTIRPRLHFPEPWTGGRVTAFGSYVEVSRPGRDQAFDLMDDFVAEGSVRVSGTLTFFAGDAPLGEQLALKFAHEC